MSQEGKLLSLDSSLLKLNSTGMAAETLANVVNDLTELKYPSDA